MKPYISTFRKACIFSAFLLIAGCTSIVCAFSSFDYSGPVLSERNPNGSVDYWYLLDNAAQR